MIRQSRLTNADLLKLGITREQSEKQNKLWRNLTGGIIPGSNEKSDK